MAVESLLKQNDMLITKKKYPLLGSIIYLGLLLIAFIGIYFGLTSSTNSSTPATDTPNFIVIFTDDLGYGDLGCFGNPIIQTPHLDQMAEEGQKWTQFYVADAVCTPSRAGLLTGRYPIRNGMTSAKRGVLFPDSNGGLPNGEITIAEMLKQKNYATAAIGKWHLGHLPQFLPPQQGFDYYYGIPYSNDMDFVKGSPKYHEQIDDPNYYSDPAFFNVPLIENTTEIERPADQNTITRRYTEKAVAFIKEHKESPFFIYLAHSLPHIPLFTHPEFRGSSKQGLYGDVIQEIDWSVGQILQTIKDLDLEKQTVVVFSSDNGPWLAFKTHGGSAGPLRAGKGTTFEGGQRVPTIFWGPSYVKPGVVNEMGATMDLMATFASLSGTQIPTDRKMDSYDLSPVLKGIGQSPRDHFFYWTQGILSAVRKGPWKLHIQQRAPVYYWNKIEMARPELYHVEADISEKYDRFDAFPAIVDSLQQLFKAHEVDIQDALPDNLVGRIETRN